MNEAAVTPTAAAEARMRDELSAVIMAAKIGRTRKDAQEDTCAVFAAALYDLLRQRGIPAQMFTASPSASTFNMWYHAVVKVGKTCYDSMGVFSEEIFRARAKIHPRVTMNIVYKRDVRDGCYEDDFEEMYLFYMKMLGKAMNAAEFGRSAEARPGSEAAIPEEPEPVAPRF